MPGYGQSDATYNPGMASGASDTDVIVSIQANIYRLAQDPTAEDDVTNDVLGILLTYAQSDEDLNVIVRTVYEEVRTETQKVLSLIFGRNFHVLKDAMGC